MWVKYQVFRNGMGGFWVQLLAGHQRGMVQYVRGDNLLSSADPLQDFRYY